MRALVLATLATVTLVHIGIGAALPPPHTQYAPLRLAPEARALRDAGQWLRAGGGQDRAVLTGWGGRAAQLTARAPVAAALAPRHKMNSSYVAFPVY